MTYPQRLLNPGEEVAFDLHPHWWYFVGLALSAVAIVAGLIIAPQVLPQNQDTVRRVTLYVLLGLAALWAVWFLIKFLAWRTTHFVLTGDRLIFRSGMLGRQGREIPLERVNDLSFHQSLFERLVGTGDLMIESAGERGQDTFSRIPHPDRAQQAIYTQMEANRRRLTGQPVPTEAAAPSIPAQINELAQLRDKGLVTEEEFQAKKADLLSRM